MPSAISIWSGVSEDQEDLRTHFWYEEERGQRRRLCDDFESIEEIRESVRYKYPGVQITADKDPAGPPQGKAINIEVEGEDYDSLIVFADKLKSFINSKNIPGIEELKLEVEMGKPELIIEIDRAKARRLNLSSGQIGSAIRTAVFGKEVSKYKEGEDDYPIVIRFDESFRHNIETLMNQRITFRDQMTGKISPVPISA